MVAVVDHGTMRAAAERLHVSQPALSRAVRDLESELRVPLFERSGRNVVPAREAGPIIDAVRRVCDDVDALVALAGSAGSPLVIAASPSVASAITETALASFARAVPDVRIQIMPARTSGDVERMVADGRAELGLLPESPGAGLVLLATWPAEVLVISPVELDIPDPVPVSRLATIPFVLPPGGSPRRAVHDQLFAGLGIEPRVALESEDRAASVSAVTAGIGSMIGLSIAGIGRAAEGTIRRTIDPPVRITVHLVRGDRRLSEVGAKFVDSVLSESGDAP